MVANNEEIKRGRGRPKEENAYRNVHTLRLDDDDESKLMHIIVEDGGSRSDIMRKALRLYYTVRSNKWR